MKFTVTNKHIRGAKRIEPWQCPIARALTEKIGFQVAVGSKVSCYGSGEIIGRLSIPAMNAMHRFYETGKFTPRTFVLVKE